MKITVEDFEKIVKSPHFLHLTSINWLVLKRDCVLTHDIEYPVHKVQDSINDNLCKCVVQVDIYLKLLLLN